MIESEVSRVSADQNKATGPTIPSDPAQIEARIIERRAHLAATVDELVERTKPKALAMKGKATVQAKATAAVQTPDGQWRTERVAAVGAAFASLVALIVWNRRRIARKERTASARKR